MAVNNDPIKKAYDSAAVEYRAKYDSIPVRKNDVDLVFSYCESIKPKVFEIGCAYGREGAYIVTKTPFYIGIDISEKYIEMAKIEIKQGDFICTDVMLYDFPQSIDIVFAFASLLHLDKASLGIVLDKVYESLNPGGIIFLSLKHSDTYSNEMVTDECSTRMFYYYNREIINDLSNGKFTEEFYDEQTLKQHWFTMILRKKTQ